MSVPNPTSIPAIPPFVSCNRDPKTSVNQAVLCSEVKLNREAIAMPYDPPRCAMRRLIDSW